MNRLFLLFFLLLMFPQQVSAQWFDVRLSTAQEGILRGQGAAATGQGFYLNSLGNYNIKQQNAYRAQLENEAFRIRTRRELEAERVRIHKQNHPDYFTREMTRLDAQEAKLVVEARRLDLKRKEAEMRAKGQLPPKPKYKYKGMTYDSYSAFKKSPAYQHKKAESARIWKQWEIKRAAEKAAEEKRQREAIAWLRDWHSKSPAERSRLTEQKRRNASIRKIMGEDYYEKFMKKN